MKRLVQFDTSQSDSYADPSFSHAIIQWQKQHGRHNLPWQQSRDPYRVWLSEIMLQQTQVSAVIPYYQRFLSSFPTVLSLADATSEQVMSHWSGLGYYTRARNLHACAKQVVNDYGGAFPATAELLAELPGIGKSTAAAIAAFSFGARAAILDGNVKRVFARVFGIEGFPGTKAVEDDLWLRAQALMPEHAGPLAIQAYTQGLMDLGATLCTRTKPRCGVCPLQTRCVAWASNRVAELPTKKIKKAVPTKQVRMLLVVDDQQVLLEKRAQQGIWGGLYSLPELVDLPSQTKKQNHTQFQQVLRPFGELHTFQQLTVITHVFSHFKLQITPFLCTLKVRYQGIGEATHLWYPLAGCDHAPLPAPIKKLLLQQFSVNSLQGSQNNETTE